MHILEDWYKDVKAGNLHEADVERSEAYAHDILGGLKLLRTFSQGVAVFGSARTPEEDKYYNKARELGHLLAQNGHTVITGGGPGIMEAANRGAYEYGGRSVGLNIVLPHEQAGNPYVTDAFTFEYFFTRKTMLIMASKVFVIFPGGFGSLDEFSEVLTMIQTKKMPPLPLFLYGKSYWRPLDKFFSNRLVGTGMITKQDTKLYKLTDDVEEIVRAANKIGHPKIDESIYDKFRAV